LASIHGNYQTAQPDLTADTSGDSDGEQPAGQPNPVRTASPDGDEGRHEPEVREGPDGEGPDSEGPLATAPAKSKSKSKAKEPKAPPKATRSGRIPKRSARAAEAEFESQEWKDFERHLQKEYGGKRRRLEASE
jgi:hypothetical protein